MGRPKGVPNKLTGEVRAMILAALDAAGGQTYLERIARENPVAFLSLLGRLLPHEVKAQAQLASPVALQVRFVGAGAQEERTD